MPWSKLEPLRFIGPKVTKVKISKSSSFDEFSFRILLIFSFDEISNTDLGDLEKSWGNIFNDSIIQNSDFHWSNYYVPYLFDFHPKITSEQGWNK